MRPFTLMWFGWQAGGAWEGWGSSLQAATPRANHLVAQQLEKGLEEEAVAVDASKHPRAAEHTIHELLAVRIPGLWM